MRAIFLCPPSRAFGEINTLLALARGIVSRGGTAWFLASPNAAVVARSEFPLHTFEMTGNCERNRIALFRMIRKFRPHLLVFSEFYEIIVPRRRADCPLIDRATIEALESVDATLVFVDFIAHTPVLREIARCETCAERFGSASLRRFLRRLFVMLPCPLNDPTCIDRQRGIPYRSVDLPRRLSAAARNRVRSLFLGDSPGFLVLRTGSTWQSKLAEKQGINLYRHLGTLLGYYFEGLPKPVTLVSVSSAHRLESPRGARGFRICNVENLLPIEFERLVLAADLVLTDNEIAYTLGTTVGRVPSVVLINSREGDELLEDLDDEPVRRVVAALEHERPGSVYPHKVFPIRAGRDQFTEADDDGECVRPSSLRLGRMRSSPFVRAEMYGGRSTRRRVHQLLCDGNQRGVLEREDASYIARVNALEDGASVLGRLSALGSLAAHSVL